MGQVKGILSADQKSDVEGCLFASLLQQFVGETGFLGIGHRTGLYPECKSMSCGLCQAETRSLNALSDKMPRPQKNRGGLPRLKGSKGQRKRPWAACPRPGPHDWLMAQPGFDIVTGDQAHYTPGIQNHYLGSGICMLCNASGPLSLTAR